VVGAKLDAETIEADAIVIAMGPWSALAARWLSLPPVFGLKGHSIVFETGELIPPEALFLEYEETAGSMLAPEVFPRPNGQPTYVLFRARLLCRPIPRQSPRMTVPWIA
jgi:glycine/D-amino acid oxidase-like deaminating enzyme